MSNHWIVSGTVGSLRRICRHPRNSVHLALMLALGFGCVIGSFDIAYGLLHSPLPSPYADRIVVTGSGNAGNVLYAYDRPNPRLSTVFQSASEFELMDANLDSGHAPVRIRAAMVSPQFFSTLGIPMALGRDFTSAEQYPEPSSQPVFLPVVISYDLWHNYFGDQKAALDHPIDLNISPYCYQIVGVAPPDVNFPSGVDVWFPTHLVSFSLIQTAGVPTGSSSVVGLLKPGVSITAAAARIKSWPKQSYFDSAANRIVHLVPLRDYQAGEIYPLSLRLSVASGLLFLLILVAAAAVVHTEAGSRREEFAIRLSLGAAPGRLFGSLVIANVLVISVALVASLLIRFILMHVAETYLSMPKGFHSELLPIDFAMGAAAAFATFTISTLVLGRNLRYTVSVFSVLEMLRSEPIASLRSSVASRYWIPAQMIPATIILITAALLTRSAYKTSHIDPRVGTRNSFIGEVSFSSDFDSFLKNRIDPKWPQAKRDEAYKSSAQLFHTLMNASVSETVATLLSKSGVVSAGAISVAPYRGYRPLSTDAQFSSTSSFSRSSPGIQNAIFRSMTPGAIPALGMRILYGQNFIGTSADDNNTVLVNAAAAAKIGAGSVALGNYIQMIGLPPSRIIGIVDNVHEQSVYSEVLPTIYFPFSQYGLADIDLVVQSSREISSREALSLMRQAVHSTSPDATVSHVETVQSMVESAGMLTRYSAYYLLALASLSIILAGFCTSAAILSDFQRRKQEIGIRMALGATRERIIGMFVLSDLARNLCAALGGALLAWWFAHLLNYLLFDVQMFDPTSYSVGVTGLIGSIALVQMILLRKLLQRNPRDLFQL